MKELHLKSVLPPLCRFAPVLCAQKSFGNTLSHTLGTYLEVYNQSCTRALPDPGTQLKCTHCLGKAVFPRLSTSVFYYEKHDIKHFLLFFICSSKV